MRGRCSNKALPHPSISVTFTAAFLLTLSMICCRCGTGIAFEATGRDVLDLLQGLNTSSRHSLSGLRFISGPNNGTPILLLEDNNRHLSLADTVVAKTARILRDHNEFTFLCSVRQDEGDSGTIVALTSNATRSLFLELESSGRRNELRFHYRHKGQVRVETFHYRLADGRWHKLALTVSGDQVSVYVDCNRIYKRVVPTLDRPQNTATLSLFVGQRNRHQALFRGALQDVKIVTQAHGFLLQCPDEDTDCPTCANFQALERRVRDMSSMYKELTNQLIRAEQRLNDLEQCQCLQYCYDNGTQRKEGEEWMRDKCNVCRCKNGSIECHNVECAAVDCKNPVYREDECCPVCLTNCYYSGKYYDHGEGVSPRVCVTCRCQNGKMVCERQDTKETCPKLDCPDKDKIEIHGQCCPVCNGTDFCALGHTCHSNASCINLATKYACHCHSGYQGDGHHCQDIDECQEKGGRYGHHCSANTKCVNTPGSYRCECIKGHNRLDSYECKDYDECVHGTHKCDVNAHCVNVNGSYLCTCQTGYDGDGFDCKPHCHGECRNGGHCIAPNICECRHGYIGPNCELDIDECALALSKCHEHSVCVNIPGWYHCDCLEGYHSSSWHDNNYGSLCWDIDECKGEGDGHTCHPSMECVNTAGGYKCECVPPGPCHESCLFEGNEHRNGSRWISRVDSCKHCRCEAGRTICHHAPCNCHDPNVDLGCCPSCDINNTCKHQERSVTYHSGDTWVYDCQTCECLHGEVDCWPLTCPTVTCQNAIQRPGDCCPVCEDSNLCAATTLETGGQDLSQTTCTYNGIDYIHGEEWILESDPCTSCQCKAGHICCTFSKACSTPYAHGG